MSNPTEGMSYADYATLSESERKRLWSSGQRKQAAIEKARKESEPDRTKDEQLLTQLQTRIDHLHRKGITNTGVLERERDTILRRIAADADLAARKESDSGALTQKTFSEYREFIKQHGSVDQVVEFDAACETYWANGGDGEPSSDEWAKVASQYASLRVEVENVAEAKAREAQAEADMAQRQADLKQHDANQLKQDDSTEGGTNEGGTDHAKT